MCYLSQSPVSTAEGATDAYTGPLVRSVMGNGCSTLVLVVVLLVDYWSSLMETCLLSSTSRAKVILCMKGIFARHGVPLWCGLHCNGPQFANYEFAELSKEYRRISAPDVKSLLSKIQLHGKKTVNTEPKGC